MIKRLVTIITWAFLGLAVWIIAKEIRIVGGKHLMNLIASTPFRVIGIGFVWITLDYLVLSGYDGLALAYIGKKLSYLKILKIATLSFAFSNTTGHTYAAGGAVRYLLYRPLGLTQAEVLKMILFETLTVFIGIAVSFLLAIGLRPFEGVGFPILSRSLYLMAGVLLIVLIGYYLFGIVRPRKWKIKKIELPPPTPRMSLAQIGVGVLDNLLIFCVFYTFLKYYLPAPFLETFTVFILAQSIGFMAQIPGGLGVFEGSFLYLFPHNSTQKSGILAALILFRIFYYFVPFILATLCLGIHFIRKRFSFLSSE